MLRATGHARMVRWTIISERNEGHNRFAWVPQALLLRNKVSRGCFPIERKLGFALSVQYFLSPITDNNLSIIGDNDNYRR